MVRQRDIAKELNISRTTVARAFAGKNVSEETREKVFEMAKKLGYVPNYVATTLSTKNTKTVYCFLIGTIDEGYCQQMENGIQSASQVWSGYGLEFKVMFTDINEAGDQRKKQREQFDEIVDEFEVDGIMCSPLSEENKEYFHNYCEEHGIPMMTLDLLHRDTSLCHIGGSLQKLGRTSASYLAEIMACKGKVLAIYYDDTYGLSSRRREGFLQRLKEYSEIEYLCVQVDGISTACYKKVLEAYIPQFHPTAIHAFYKVDNVIEALKQMGDSYNYRMISNGINKKIEEHLYSGKITGIVSARPFHQGAVAASNFCKYFYRGSELLRGEIDVGLDIYIKENYKRFQDIF